MCVCMFVCMSVCVCVRACVRVHVRVCERIFLNMHRLHLIDNCVSRYPKISNLR